MRKVKIKNTRRYKRFHADFLVKYDPEGKGDFQLTNSRDLGAGGMRFWSDRPLPVSSTMEVSILVPPLGREVAALAEVRRVTGERKSGALNVAVGFLDIPEEDREAIDEVAERSSGDREAKFWVDHHDVARRKS